MDEFDFWGLQITEHALFVGMSLVDANLRQKALELHQALGAAYNARDLPTFLARLDEFIAFKETGLAQIKAGNWIGWGFPSLLRHMLDEERFFLAKLQNTISPEQEMTFWLKERLEENELAVHLLDPVEGGAIAKVATAANQFAALGKRCLTGCDPSVIRSAQALGILMNRELAEMAPGRPQSVIPPELKAHVEREGQRFVQTAGRILHTGR